MLKPVDLQQSIAQIHVAEKIQQVQQQHPDMQQRHFALQLNEERKRQKERVRDTDEAELLRLREEEEREGRGRRGRREGGDNPQPAPEGSPAATAPGEKGKVHIDIKA
ncbi:MAG TPA: hypothetical protein P5269_02920 [Syntrophales bacterium]|nr:hypothetical protein [Syntrophales bacterium]HRV42151.1 hypothetical protein [Syntrophales bacterium]